MLDGDERPIRSVRGRSAFDEFRRSGRRVRAGSLTVVAYPLDLGESPAMSFAISRKVGSAVVRNRIRRRLKEHLRTTSARTLLSSSAYLVIVAPSAAEASASTLGADLDSALERLART